MLVPDVIRQCVVFICHKESDQYKLGGTAFFMARETPDNLGFRFIYLVTAKHAIVQALQRSQNGKVYLRLNLTDGGVHYFETDPGQWKYHPSNSSVDVAVINIAPRSDQVEYVALAQEMILTDTKIQEEEIGVGDEVFLTGLFVNHIGQKRNLPIIRTGNIALMPEEPIATKDFGSMEAYLVESRSIGGLSGSPVFVHKPNIRIRNGALQYTSTGKGSFFLLGLMHGHWDVPIATTDMVSEDTPGKEHVNMGIAMVVPAQRISEVIDHPEFVDIRDKEIAQHRLKMQLE